jgi:hypothetical protein
VHTIGFGKEKYAHDVEIEDVSLAASATANARMTATVSFTQRGYAGQKATLTVRDGDKTLAAREVTLAPTANPDRAALLSHWRGRRKESQFWREPLPGEENLSNNSVSRPMLVSDAKRRILYVEGEPRWEYKFIRRAEDDDPTVQIVSMLRTSENKIYRQGIADPSELADGFPGAAGGFVRYQASSSARSTRITLRRCSRSCCASMSTSAAAECCFWAAASSLSDGGWGASSMNDCCRRFCRMEGELSIAIPRRWS